MIMKRFQYSLVVLIALLSCSLVSAERLLIDINRVEEEPVVSETVKPPAKVVAPPEMDEILLKIQDMADRDTAVREAAIRRLMPYPKEAGELVVQVFSDGSLSARLATLDLLRHWTAPVEGLDPWRPETLTKARLAALEDWLKNLEPEEIVSIIGQPTEEQRAEASEEIARMLRVSDAEADAIRERLARSGAALLPLVYEQLRNITGDRDRLRLQALRYRLVADESLQQRWPGGLLRLASLETSVRQKAAEELVELAAAEDQPLLRELFSDPNPLVREICLRGMQKIGGEAQEILLDLLADPEPNVRAAVLKQLEENPGPGASAKITEYVKTETDADLVGHAVRVLSTLRGQGDLRATRSLMELLKHERWQVRAEAATSLAKGMRRISTYGNEKLSPQDQIQVDVYVALVERLEDEDSFVVSKAMEGLKRMDMPAAVEPLVKSIERYPDLAPHVIEIINSGQTMREKAAPLLRELVKNEDPRVRAAILGGLSDLEESVVIAALEDPDSRGRIAAAEALFSRLDSQRNTALHHPYGRPVIPSAVAVTPPSANPLSGLFRVFAAAAKMKDSDETVTVEVLQLENVPVIIDDDEDVTAVFDMETGEKIEIDVDVRAPVLPPPVFPPPVFTPQPESVPMTPVPMTQMATPVVRPGSVFPVPEEVGFEEILEPLSDENPGDGSALPENYVLDPNMLSSDAYDQWLLDFQEGKNRPEWAEGLAERLEPLLRAESPEERLAATVLLVPLGKAEETVPLLLETLREKPEFFATFAKVIPWLTREKRVEVFQQWRSGYDASPEELGRFLEKMIAPPDRRFEPLLWDILDGDDVSIELVSVAIETLGPLYLTGRFAYRYSNTPPPNSVRDALAASLEERTKTGNENQRLVALATLIPLNAERAGEIAATLEADSTLSDEFRRDMFQIRLLTLTGEKQASELAVETLKRNDPLRSKMVLQKLVSEPYTLQILRGRIYLQLPSDFTTSFSSDRKKPTVPKGIDLETLKPLLESDNEEIAAYAGYFAVLLGDAAGMEPLLKFRQKIARSSEDIDVELVNGLTYRAIAALNDPQYIPILREIYSGLEGSDVSDFYWSIRGMTGPEILKLRKEIRTEHGVNNLM